MIRTKKQLLARLAEGNTVALLTHFDGAPHPKWAITATGETVFKTAIRGAVADEKLALLQADIAGDPMQYGLAQ